MSAEKPNQDTTENEREGTRRDTPIDYRTADRATVDAELARLGIHLPRRKG
jgi:hypothetical protein